ncbi:MAG: hypothetical protein C0609_05050 [Deltaproteobacteria bacterium]|nr:MAG: hypothetical protein C0609_05050 [Deltaproteobacteria bacterium]
MRRILSLIIAAVVILFSVTTVIADDMGQVPRIFGTFKPVAGAWSEYEVLEKDTGKTLTMRMSVLEVMGDKFWYEVVNREGGAVNIIKMLVKGDPNDSENIQRLIMKSGDSPAQEMPMDFVKMGRRMAKQTFSARSGVPADTTGITVKELGKLEVSVPAGTFMGDQKQLVDEEGNILATFITYDEILPFGIVVSDSKEAVMKLLANGSDAKSLITEEAGVMQMPPGMPKMPRGNPPGMMKE